MFAGCGHVSGLVPLSGNTEYERQLHDLNLRIYSGRNELSLRNVED